MLCDWNILWQENSNVYEVTYFFKMTQAIYGCSILIKIKKKILLLQEGTNGNPMLMQLLHETMRFQVLGNF